MTTVPVSSKSTQFQSGSNGHKVIGSEKKIMKFIKNVYLLSSSTTELLGGGILGIWAPGGAWGLTEARVVGGPIGPKEFVDANDGLEGTGRRSVVEAVECGKVDGGGSGCVGLEIVGRVLRPGVNAWGGGGRPKIWFLVLNLIIWH